MLDIKLQVVGKRERKIQITSKNDEFRANFGTAKNQMRAKKTHRS